MSDIEPVIALCHACGAAMDVSAVPPFTNCACPACGKHTRVKRDFGPYTIMRRHAEGGMSMVFGAHDNTLDREVAIKVLNETYSSDERRIAAFEREAKLTASLSHPNIVKVLTTGRAYGYFYIAMEFVAGGHFEHQIRSRGKIPEVEALEIAIEVAQGLRAAHASGLLHRDIKPGNILLDSEGHAKLVDFGLALVTQGGKATAEEIWATPYYVPPETIEGAEEDLRSDIYAFGSTIYHALAGAPPCGETSMATEKLRHAKKMVIPLSSFDPSISPETANVVDKAMAYHREDRYASYEDLIAALNRAHSYAKSGRHAASDRTEKRKQLIERKRRFHRRIAISSVIFAIFAAILLIAVTRDKKPRKNASPSQNQQPSAPGPGSQDAGAADLARNYSRARSSLSAGDYATAADFFSRLLQNTKLQEPSRTICGVEAVLAAYLNGNPRLANRYGKDLREHFQNQKDARSLLLPALASTLDRLAAFEPIATPKIEGPPGPQDLIASMFAGLKNWEQGNLDIAAACFRQAIGITIAPDDPWAVVSIYREKARDYLSDYEILTSPVFASLPKDPAACRKAADSLDQLVRNLKTRGRAPFNVEAWKLDIIRHGSLLSKPPANHHQTQAHQTHSGSNILPLIKDQIQSYRFDGAVRTIRKLNADPDGISRAALISACQSAEMFLKDLEADIAKNKADISITLPSGTQINTLAITRDGKLQAITTKGADIISWSDLTANDLISLHRMLISRNGKSDADTNLRHERAIWFDWLVGDRNRATQAASKLSESDGAYQKRWGENLRNLARF